MNTCHSINIIIDLIDKVYQLQLTL